MQQGCVQGVASLPIPLGYHHYCQYWQSWPQ